MSTSLLNVHKLVAQEYTQCVICSSPLGQDSRDLGYPYCHEHRKCLRCGLPLNQTEARFNLASYKSALYKDSLDSGEPQEFNPEHCAMEVIHTSCRITDPTATVTILKSEFELLNVLRLATTPDPELSDVTNENNASNTYANFLQINKMTHEQLFLHAKMLEACAMETRIALSQNQDHKNEIIESRKKRFDKIEKERLASLKSASRQVTPQETSKKEPTKKELRTLAYKSFIEIFSLPDNKDTEKLFRDRQGFIDSMSAMMPEAQAREAANKFLIEKGLVKEPGIK